MFYFLIDWFNYVESCFTFCAIAWCFYRWVSMRYVVIAFWFKRCNHWLTRWKGLITGFVPFKRFVSFLLLLSILLAFSLPFLSLVPFISLLSRALRLWKTTSTLALTTTTLTRTVLKFTPPSPPVPRVRLSFPPLSAWQNTQLSSPLIMTRRLDNNIAVETISLS